jgi:DNA polymerase
MNLVTIDFETYYDKSFSLSKLSTEEYIRDDRFEVLGVGIKFGKKQAVWYAGEAVAPALQAIDWSKYMVIAHNAMFDAAILSWIYDHHPNRWIDTLSMARAIDGLEVSGSLKAAAERHELGVKGEEVVAALGKRLKDFTIEELQRYGEYCKNDCDLTHSLFLLYMDKYDIFVTELTNIDLTIKMFAEPVLELDLPLLEQYLENLKSVKDALLETCGVDGDILRSNPKFAGLLESYDVAVPMKVSPTTGKDTFAFAKTDAGLQALTEHPDERVQAAVSARLGIKSSIAETRAQRFIDIAKRGKLPVPLKYYAAHTGRWGGTDKINLQNLPSRGGSTVLRQAIRAPEGYLILDCDSAQIEARVLAWLAGQDDLVADFAAGKDVYKIMAGVIYNKPPEEINDAERFMGKTLVLGCGYGIGAEKFHRQLAVAGVVTTLENCTTNIDLYRDTYKAIPTLWFSAGRCLKAMNDDKNCDLGKYKDAVTLKGKNGFQLPSGYKLNYTDLELSQQGDYSYKSRNGRQKIYGGKVVENITQALARCVIADQMAAISTVYRPVLTVHDAIAVVVPADKIDEAQRFVEHCMSTAPEWAPGLPLSCKSKIGETYGG